MNREEIEKSDLDLLLEHTCPQCGEPIECDVESEIELVLMDQIAELEKTLLRPFCTEHRKHVSEGFCDECNGDRNLIQPKVKE